MKHNIKITIIIIAMFLIAQLIGLLLISSYDNYFGKNSQDKIKSGEIKMPDISLVKENVPPQQDLKRPIDVIAVISSIVIAIILATLLFLLLSRIRSVIIIKVWFTFVIFICLSIAISLLIYPLVGQNFINIFGKSFSLAEVIAVPLAIVFTFFKIFKRNIIVHNLTELLVYPGLAIIFIPILNVIAVCILLVAISIYDIIAVWKTKHMVNLAKFQIDQLKIFTGFFIPYINPKDRVKMEKLRVLAKFKEDKKKKKLVEKGLKKINVQVAALGGGDVAFPLIFTGIILLTYGLLPAIATILFETVALALLLLFSQKGKFYPAMPFLSAGCFAGLLVSVLFLI